MAGRTQWTAGNGVGLTWTAAINGSDLAGMASTNSVLSTVADITNGTNLDMYADFSIRMTISSATPSGGASFGLYIYPLLDDGATYGDGVLTAGTQKVYTPPSNLFAGTVPIQSAAATTLMAGYLPRILLPPGSFRLALLNNTGVTLSATAGNCIVKYRTYNLQLNN